MARGPDNSQGPLDGWQKTLCQGATWGLPLTFRFGNSPSPVILRQFAVFGKVSLTAIAGLHADKDLGDRLYDCCESSGHAFVCRKLGGSKRFFMGMDANKSYGLRSPHHLPIFSFRLKTHWDVVDAAKVELIRFIPVKSIEHHH